MRMWLIFSWVRMPSKYQQRSHMPVVGAGLRQRGPKWKASICTRNMVSFRLGQSHREMRGRMRAPRVLEIVAVEWWRCGTQVVLLVEVSVYVWGPKCVGMSTGETVQLKPVEVVDIGAIAGNGAKGCVNGTVGVCEMGGVGTDCRWLRCGGVV